MAAAGINQTASLNIPRVPLATCPAGLTCPEGAPRDAGGPLGSPSRNHPPTGTKRGSPRIMPDGESRTSAKRRGQRKKSSRTSQGLKSAYPTQAPDQTARPHPRPGEGTNIKPDSLEIVPKHLRSRGMTQLGHSLRLDLADAFTSDPVNLPDLVEGSRLPIGEAEAQPNHSGLALGQRGQHRLQLVLKQSERHRVDGDDSLGVLDEVTELGVALVTDRLVQRNGLPGVLLDLQHLLGGDVHFLGQLLRSGLAPKVLEQLALDTTKLVDDLDHVDRYANGPGLVGHGAGDRLPDPPGGVRGELVALGVVELLDRADETQVALLDQVQERHAAAGVALGQRDDQAEVGLQQVVLRPLTVTHDPAQVAAELRVQLLRGLLLGLPYPLRRVEAGFDPLGELDLLLGVEQCHLADLLQVGTDRVRRRGELGVLAGLTQGLRLLLVPDEVAVLAFLGVLLLDLFDR